jgi:hypothetical protein
MVSRMSNNKIRNLFMNFYIIYRNRFCEEVALHPHFGWDLDNKRL